MIDIYIKPSQRNMDPSLVQSLIDLIDDSYEEDVTDLLKEYDVIFE